MGVSKQRIGQIIQSKIALQIKLFSKKDNKNNRIKKTRAEITEEKIKLSEGGGLDHGKKIGNQEDG